MLWRGLQEEMRIRIGEMRCVCTNGKRGDTLQQTVTP